MNVTVRVLDVNEHSPEFTQRLYNVSISEDSGPGVCAFIERDDAFESVQYMFSILSYKLKEVQKNCKQVTSDQLYSYLYGVRTGTVVARVEATDRDADANGRVLYSLAPGAGDLFSILLDGMVILNVRTSSTYATHTVVLVQYYYYCSRMRDVCCVRDERLQFSQAASRMNWFQLPMFAEVRTNRQQPVCLQY